MFFLYKKMKSILLIICDMENLDKIYSPY